MGNDFILIDDRLEEFDVKDANSIAKLCDRKFGIGADGLILLRKHHTSDFQMIYFNADGRESSMCGNGGMCIVKFAHYLKIFHHTTTFQAIDGPHQAYFHEESVVLRMIDVYKVQTYQSDFIINTGSPHYVRFVDNLANVNVCLQGRKIRHSKKFTEQGGINVNFVQIVQKQHLKVRTYERGVENETLSCGTGATAVAIVAAFSQKWNSPIKIETLGGELGVNFQQKKGVFKRIFLAGAAKKVFEGKISA